MNSNGEIEMLTEIKEHLKFISLELQDAQSSIEHYAGDNTPDDAPFLEQAARLDRLHNDYADVVLGIATGVITSADQALAHIKTIEGRSFPNPQRTGSK